MSHKGRGLLWRRLYGGVLAVSVAVGLAVAGLVLVRRRVPLALREEHNGTTAVVFGALYVTYALMVGFALEYPFDNIVHRWGRRCSRPCWTIQEPVTGSRGVGMRGDAIVARIAGMNVDHTRFGGAVLLGGRLSRPSPPRLLSL